MAKKPRFRPQRPSLTGWYNGSVYQAEGPRRGHLPVAGSDGRLQYGDSTGIRLQPPDALRAN